MINDLGYLYEYIDQIDKDLFYILELETNEGKVVKTYYLYGGTVNFDAKAVKRLCDEANLRARFFLNPRSHKRITIDSIGSMAKAIDAPELSGDKIWRDMALLVPNKETMQFAVKCRCEDVQFVSQFIDNVKQVLKKGDEVILVSDPFNKRLLDQMAEARGYNIQIMTDPDIIVYEN